MRFFNKNYESKDNKTTRNIIIGKTEAEDDDINLYFEDYLSIVPTIFDNNRFIVTGRKGSGKTALGKYIENKSKEDANVFCKFIKKSEIDLDKIVQAIVSHDKNKNENFMYTSFFKWVILTQFVSLLMKDASIENDPKIKDLKQFLIKNRGFIDIKNDEIIETITSSGLEIKTEKLNKFFSALFRKENKEKSGKASFFKLIKPLEDVIDYLLEKTSDNQNGYIFIFDDLDINFEINNSNHKENLCQLIRLIKELNLKYKDNNIDAKIIILLRDDISENLMYSPDMPKIFSSYEAPIVWYNHDQYSDDENKVNLKKLINKRLKNLYEKNKIKCEEGKEWNTLINEKDFKDKNSSFKYIIENTFYRPRDLILFFNPLSEKKYRMPMSKNNIDELKKIYAKKLLNEIKSELCLFYAKEKIDEILTVIKFLKNNPSSPKNINDKLNDSVIVDNLFNYSLIVKKQDNRFYSKYRGEDGFDESKEYTYELSLPIKNCMKFT